MSYETGVSESRLLGLWAVGRPSARKHTQADFFRRRTRAIAPGQARGIVNDLASQLPQSEESPLLIVGRRVQQNLNALEVGLGHDLKDLFRFIFQLCADDSDAYGHDILGAKSLPGQSSCFRAAFAITKCKDSEWAKDFLKDWLFVSTDSSWRRIASHRRWNAE